MLKSLFVIPLVVPLLASTGWADSEPDYGRPGWYVGAGAGAGFDFFDVAVSNETGGIVDIGPAGSINARGGYRVTSWFAVELMYEGAYSFDTQLLGSQIASFDTHSLLSSFKFILPTWRIHPYFALAPGVQYGHFNGRGPFEDLDTDRWDFMLRFGLGVDAYITENWLVNFEAAPSVRFADYSNIPSQTTDNVTLTLSAGVQYRF